MIKTKLIAFWHSFKNSFRLFTKHDTLTLGAALSYYTGFSLIPIIIIVISIAGSILGPQAVQGELKNQLAGLLGNHNATQLEGIIKAAYVPGESWFGTGIAVIILLIGATSVFSQLHTSLNLIWGVKHKERQPFLQFFTTRLFSFAMIVCISFLLLVSFVTHAMITSFANYLGSFLPYISIFLINAFNLLLAYGFTALLFALVFKYMSDADLSWKTIWPGAFFTAFLFVIGKFVMGLYFGKLKIDDGYGAAGSIVLLLTWVFYSSQIVFFGAEFTHALAAENGKLLDPLKIIPDADAEVLQPNVEGKNL